MDAEVLVEVNVARQNVPLPSMSNVRNEGVLVGIISLLTSNPQLIIVLSFNS